MKALLRNALPYIRRSWDLSWPLILIMLFDFLINLTDVFIAGRIGKEVQASIGFIAQLYFLFIVVANALTVVGLWFVAAKMEVERTMTRSEVPVPAKPYRLDFLVVYSFVFVVSISTVLMAFWV